VIRVEAMKMGNQKRFIKRRFVLDERGTSMIELAIVLPIMLLLMASIAEFGRFFYTYTTLAKATRAGARYIAAQPYACGTYRLQARNLVVCGKPTCAGGDAPVVKNLTISNVDITTTPGEVTLPDKVTVAISGYRYQTIFGIGGLTGGVVDLNIPVAPSTTMKYLLTDPCSAPG